MTEDLKTLKDLTKYPIASSLHLPSGVTISREKAIEEGKLTKEFACSPKELREEIKSWLKKINKTTTLCLNCGKEDIEFRDKCKNCGAKGDKLLHNTHHSSDSIGAIKILKHFFNIKGEDKE